MEITKANLEAKGAVAGDLVLICPYAESTEPLACSVSGGGQVPGSQKEEYAFRTTAFWRIWDGSTAYKVTWGGGSVTSSLSFAVFRSADPSVPIDAQGVYTSVAGAGGKAFTATGVTTATDHSMQVIMETNSMTTSPNQNPNKTPTGFTLATNGSPALVYRTKETAGATGTTEFELVGTPGGGTIALNFAVRGKDTTATRTKVARVSLTAGGIPSSRENHKIVARAKKASGTTVKLFASLYEGEYSRALVELGTLTTSLATYEAAISKTAAETITSYANLEIRFWAESTTGDKVEIQVSDLELILPEGALEEVPTEEKSGGGDIGGTAGTGVVPIATAEKPTQPVSIAVEVVPRDSDATIIGPDEAELRVGGGSLQTELNGGFGPANVTIPTSAANVSPKTWLLRPVRLFDASTDQTLYEGRIVNIAKSGTQVTLECEGWAKHLGDDETAREIFIDREVTAWGGPSLQREASILTGPYDFTKGHFETRDAGSAATPALTFSFESFSAGINEIIEVWYGFGIELGEIDYDWTTLKAGTVNVAVYACPDDTAGGTIQLLKTHTSTSTAGVTQAVSPGNKNLLVQLVYGGEFVGPSIGDTYSMQDVRVKGRHGIEAHGSGVEEGLYVSDMVRYIVTRWAPLLRIGSSFESTSFSVPQAAFKDPGTALAMIESLLLFGGSGAQPLDWGVYNKRELFMAEPGKYGRTWRVRNDQTAESEDQGADSTERINGVMISYDPGDGQKRSIGPIGSGASVETAELEDTSPSNPANSDGARHWRSYDAGIMNESQAKLVAGLILAQSASIKWRGAITVKGWAQLDGGGWYPAALMRSGDRVIVEDDPADDFDPRQIRNTTYDFASDVVGCSVGAPPDWLDVLLARAGVTLQARGITA